MAKTIVITGASSGLGAALALTYADHGVILGLIGRHTERLNHIAAQCQAKGATTIIGELDVTDSHAMSDWLNTFDQQHPVDIIIANAGISAGTGGGGESLAQVKKIFAINIDGVLNTIHPLIEPMKARKHGQIAIVSSIAGFRGSPTAPAYSTSKAAVRVYGQALQGLLTPHGLTVSVICPGFIRSPMTDVNSFPMPFIMDADKAAAIIMRGITKRQTLIVFPWIMGALARVQNALPDRWVNWLYSHVPAKKSSD
jgi:short-subunit dehydrogenase